MRSTLTFILMVFSGILIAQNKIDTFKIVQISATVIGEGENADYRIDGNSMDLKEYKKTLAKVEKINAIMHKDKLYYARTYSIDDKLMSEGHQFNECMLGYHRTYHSNGTMSSEGFYLEPNFEYDKLPRSFCSKREGLWKFYNNSGKVTRETVYKEGKVVTTKDL